MRNWKRDNTAHVRGEDDYSSARTNQIRIQIATSETSTQEAEVSNHIHKAHERRLQRYVNGRHKIQV